MATILASYNRSNEQLKSAGHHSVPELISSSAFISNWSNIHPAAFVVGMAGYFLLLASIAVVFITQQFPWFLVAPITILLAYAYLKHAESKWRRRTSHQLQKP